MAMDDLPRPANPTIDLGGIPARQDTFRSILQFSIIDKVECQERYISMTLDLGIDHVVPWIRSRIHSNVADTPQVPPPKSILDLEGLAVTRERVPWARGCTHDRNEHL